MNKQEMTKAIAIQTGLTQVDTGKMLDALEKITFDTISKGDKVQLTGFLIIKPVYRASRKGFDPIKKAPMNIPPTVGVSVKAGEKLQKATKSLNIADFAPKEEKVKANVTPTPVATTPAPAPAPTDAVPAK